MDNSLKKRKISEEQSQIVEVKNKKFKSFFNVLAKYEDEKTLDHKTILQKVRKDGVKLIDENIMNLLLEFSNTGLKKLKNNTFVKKEIILSIAVS